MKTLVTLSMCTNSCSFTRKECDDVASQLGKVGILSVSYHAGLSDSERTMIQEKWLNGNRCKVRLCPGLEITENSRF